MIIKTKEKFNIIGRGTAYSISLEENDLPKTRKEFNPLLMGKEVEIDGKPYTVIGIESRGVADDVNQYTIGILVKG